MELDTLLRRGRERIHETSRAHAERWGLGTSHRWVLDQDEGRILWSFEDRVVSAPAQVLGSWNAQVSSFVWAWDNDTVRAPLCVTAEEVRAFGTEHDVPALCGSPLRVDEEQVRDLVALAFSVGACTGLFHPFDGRLATYLTFGAVTIEESGGRVSTYEVDAE